MSAITLAGGYTEKAYKERVLVVRGSINQPQTFVVNTADVLAGRPLQRKRICRTFSDCTTAPRNGLVSGCYPLDDHYKTRPEAAVLAVAKDATRV